MANVLSETPPPATIADLLAKLGGISPSRVRLRPFPGTATEQDVIDVEAREDRLCELVDGVLVEKTVGCEESELAFWLGRFLLNFVVPRSLGIVLGIDAMLRLAPDLVRLPDVVFISWDRLPGRKRPTGPIYGLAPDLAVEILSKGNTKKEMERKLREYFETGVRLVWYIDPETRTVRIFTGADQSVLLHEDQTLDGGDVLPGFQLPLRELFTLPE